MKLEAYLKKHKLTQAEYAAQIGTTQQQVSKWIKRGCLVDEGHPYPKYIKQDLLALSETLLIDNLNN